MKMMNTCSINPKVIEKIPAPSDIEAFKKIREEARVFTSGVTNESAKELDFSTAKNLLPNIEVEASYSVDNNDTVIPVKLHDFLDYCAYDKSFDSNIFTHQEGIPRKKTFKGENIYLFNFNCMFNDQLAEFVSCPSYIDDWFGKYFPIYTKCIVYGASHTWFFIGPKGTKTEMHTDHDSIHTTIQQLDGEKMFFLLSPDQMLFVRDKMGENFFKNIEFSHSEEGYEVRSLTNQCLRIFRDLDLLVTTLKKHDTVYLPESWGHYANSLSPSISVSRDFIDERNADKYFFSMMAISKNGQALPNLIPNQLLYSVVEEHYAV
jgi:hypothetical protein